MGSNALTPRACGPGAWHRWLLNAFRLVCRTPWEIAASILLMGLVAAWVAIVLPGILPGLFICFIAIRWPLWSLANNLQGARTRLSLQQACQKMCEGKPPALSWGILAWIFSMGLVVQGGWLWMSNDQAWVSLQRESALHIMNTTLVWSWLMWCLRSFGPMGFLEILLGQGCSWSQAYSLHYEALRLNGRSCAFIVLVWAGLAVAVAFFPWIAPLLLIGWSMVAWSMYQDMLGGGLDLPVLEKTEVRSLKTAIG